MSAAIPPPLSSPGVGARRKGPLPRLPLSAFTPPNSGTSDRFPLPPSPSSIHPTQVIDAHAATPGGDLSKWVQESRANTALSEKLSGTVVSLAGTAPADVEKALQAIRSSSTSTPITAVLVPYSLEEGAPSEPPAYLTSDSSTSFKIVLLAVYTRYSPEAVKALAWAIEKGLTIDLEIRTNLRAGEGAWQDLEEMLTYALPRHDQRDWKGNIILSNILPPPDDLSIPIVKLLTHPTYNDYQSQTAALSLYPNVTVKFLPPSWASDSIDTKEWKRRIKMYIGPALEAFGYERILFGSSTASSAPSALSVGEWYELARESFAELGTEQEDIQAVFCDNAKRVYGS